MSPLKLDLAENQTTYYLIITFERSTGHFLKYNSPVQKFLQTHGNAED